MSARSWLPVVASIAVLTLPASSLADAPPPGSWASELQGLATAMQHDEECTQHCFALEHLQIKGSADSGAFEFQIDGGVLGKGSAEVPLFGPPASVRLDEVTLGGAPALVAFDGDHYFVRTDQKHFVIKGKITLGADHALTIIGPVNSFDAQLSQGRVTEGAHLSGVLGQTLHFDTERADVATPTIFQLSRALRVGKRSEIEYRLTLQSGSELGLVRLPLRYGERVLDVTGSTGWKVEGEELVLPTTGKTAEITVTGEIAKIGSFQPDPRSPYEWWLLESDAEHRVLATGDAKQHDSSESPIGRREPNSRLFLVQRGQHLDVTVQTLGSLDVLAGVVQSHSRTLVLTATGDLVSDDSLTYENSGIDYLLYTPTGKPIFLSTDGASERLMHKDGGSELMVPLRLGYHTARTQTLDHASANALGGWMRLPGATFPLTASHASVTLGLPRDIHAVAVLGGDQAEWALGLRDAVAIAISLLFSVLLLRGAKQRALGVVTLTGLWFISSTGFAVAVAAGILGGALWATGRLFEGRTRVLSRVGLVLVCLIGASMMMTSRSPTSIAPSFIYRSSLDQGTADTLALGEDKDRNMKAAETPAPAAPAALPVAQGWAVGGQGQAVDGRFGNFAGQLAQNGIIDGVRPVAMPLPGYDHAITITRELVTSDRPFDVTLWYLTDNALAVLGLLWLACAGTLAYANRERLRAWREALKAKLQPKVAPVQAEATAAAE